MKRFALVMGIISLALAVLVTSCAKAPPATTPATPTTPPEITSTEGPLTEVSPQDSTVTIETPQGPQTFPITPNTALTLEGRACTLDQLSAAQASSGEKFNCIATYDSDGNVLSLSVFKEAPPASVSGTISDVNIKDSTITVKTASGDQVYDVDPDTGLLIGGVACSLELVNALLEAQQESGGGAGVGLPCTVIFSTDDKGTALYVDIANPAGLTQGTGTIVSTDVAKSTVTITLNTGEQRTYEVNANTRQFLNNQVCSLDDLEAAIDRHDAASCDVIYYTDANGNLVYLDATHITN